MSEPVSNSEIEDVLSSIRRLVSDDARPTLNRSGASTAPPEDEAGRLVLTPAFRVAEEAEVAEPDEAEEPPADPPADDVLQLNAEDHAPANMDWAADPTPSGLSALEQTIAELEAAVGDREDEWEPDGSEDEDEALDRMPTFDQVAAKVVGIDFKSKQEPAFESEIFEAVEETAKEQLAADEDFDEDGFVDEDALRDIVGEIVRQELQGPLGERITRNVRKLVRREVQRAMAARDIE